MDQPVLVLNRDFDALNVCNVRRALTLVIRGKAEVLEIADVPVRTATADVEAPVVIRLARQVRRPPSRLALTRRAVFMRDNFTCQYCGLHSRDLTLDHVVPRHRGGRDAWDNLVAACRACNHRKGHQSLAASGMRLAREPCEPYVSLAQRLAHSMPAAYEATWGAYLPVK
jgi:5-methylcytosine-specific restriction endonuclease McrA